ncbi:hypothetical protein [Arenimonas oryziterrae]|uniref:Uncharacterized protein n=1 Tax=Arenimonas oryziterrae DSM 21050 = YC6267 TaxID=1121015 RepID=A0A091ATS8_9GAMM|nr:hypothetical protein [Arenimonas oryziterrae]KFN42572.1 hypothetical protein N789_13105 [Arenimonas oryziterrae DSM 21050 = YC6267]
MLQILAVALLSILSGVLLSSGAMSWPIRPGLVGCAALLVSAWAARRYWQGLRVEDGPGSPERALWHGLASFGLLFGHLSATVWTLGPVLEMHSLAGHAMALDNWTLVLGAVVSYAIARDPEPRHDERDAMIRAQGERVGHATLLLLLLPLILALGFGAHTMVGRANQPMLAHVLILIVMLRCLAQHIAQLRLYWLDTCAERSAA